jgi:hypothetical protein
MKKASFFSLKIGFFSGKIFAFFLSDFTPECVNKKSQKQHIFGVTVFGKKTK